MWTRGAGAQVASDFLVHTVGGNDKIARGRTDGRREVSCACIHIQCHVPVALGGDNTVDAQVASIDIDQDVARSTQRSHSRSTDHQSVSLLNRDVSRGGVRRDQRTDRGVDVVSCPNPGGRLEGGSPCGCKVRCLTRQVVDDCTGSAGVGVRRDVQWAAVGLQLAQ